MAWRAARQRHRRRPQRIIWRRNQQGSAQDPEFLFVKEKLSMNSVEFTRNNRALEARKGLGE